LLTFPLSVLADRWAHQEHRTDGRRLSLATLGCALATTYGEMLVARAFVGLGRPPTGA
jgi:hypothetical protein